MRGTPPDGTALARRLRGDATAAERLLWGRLRARRMAGWKFRRQVPIGRFVVDFCCPDAWLIVELDGGQHSRDDHVARDAQRSGEFERCGYLVARFWNAEVFANLDGVCDTILNLLQGAPAELDSGASPSPQPSPPRGEGAGRRPGRKVDDTRHATPLPEGERSSRGATG